MKHNLIKLVNEITSLINENEDKYIIRNKKTSMKDGIAFRLLYTKKDTTQVSVTAKINDFLDKNINRSSYSDRDKQIDIKFYEKLNTIISKITNERKQLKYTKEVFAIDGTNGFMSNKLASE